MLITICGQKSGAGTSSLCMYNSEQIEGILQVYGSRSRAILAFECCIQKYSFRGCLTLIEWPLKS